MANFNLTAQINVVGLVGLESVAKKIKDGLKGAVDVNIDVKIKDSIIKNFSANLNKKLSAVKGEVSVDVKLMPNALSEIKKELGTLTGITLQAKISTVGAKRLKDLKPTIDASTASFNNLNAATLGVVQNINAVVTSANNAASAISALTNANNKFNSSINKGNSGGSNSQGPSGPRWGSGNNGGSRSNSGNNGGIGSGGSKGGSSGSSPIGPIDPSIVSVLKQISTPLPQIRNGFFDINKEIQDFGKLSGVLLKRFAGFTIASSAVFGLAHAFSGALSEAVSFQDEMVKISQTTGLTLTTLSGLSKEVSRLGTEFGVSSKELLTSSKTLAQAGLSAGEVQKSLEAIAKASLAPSFKDVASITQTSISVMKQFGFSASGLESALGKINVLSRDSAIEAEELSSAIRKAGSSFNVAADQTLTAEQKFNQFLAIITAVKDKTGEAVESIATGTKTIFARIQRPELIEKLKRTGIGIDLEEDTVDKDGKKNGGKKFIGAYAALGKISKALFEDKKKLDGRVVAGILEDLGGVRELEKTIPLLQEFEAIQQNYAKIQKGNNSLTEDSVTAQQSWQTQIKKTGENFKSLIKELTETDSFKTLVQGALLFSNSLVEVVRTLKPIVPILASIAAIQFGKAAYSFATGIKAGVGALNKTPNLGAGVKGFADGGYVDAVLTPGEKVFSPKQVERIGKNKLDRLNNGHITNINMLEAKTVPGVGETDTVKAKLPVGSFVIKKSVARKFTHGGPVHPSLEELKNEHTFNHGLNFPSQGYYERYLGRLDNAHDGGTAEDKKRIQEARKRIVNIVDKYKADGGQYNTRNKNLGEYPSIHFADLSDLNAAGVSYGYKNHLFIDNNSRRDFDNVFKHELAHELDYNHPGHLGVGNGYFATTPSGQEASKRTRAILSQRQFAYPKHLDYFSSPQEIIARAAQSIPEQNFSHLFNGKLSTDEIVQRNLNEVNKYLGSVTHGKDSGKLLDSDSNFQLYNAKEHGYDLKKETKKQAYRALRGRAGKRSPKSIQSARLTPAELKNYVQKFQYHLQKTGDSQLAHRFANEDLQTLPKDFSDSNRELEFQKHEVRTAKKRKQAQKKLAGRIPVDVEARKQLALQTINKIRNPDDINNVSGPVKQSPLKIDGRTRFKPPIPKDFGGSRIGQSGYVGGRPPFVPSNGNSGSGGSGGSGGGGGGGGDFNNFDPFGVPNIPRKVYPRGIEGNFVPSGVNPSQNAFNAQNRPQSGPTNSGYGGFSNILNKPTNAGYGGFQNFVPFNNTYGYGGFSNYLGKQPPVVNSFGGLGRSAVGTAVHLVTKTQKVTPIDPNANGYGPNTNGLSTTNSTRQNIGNRNIKDSGLEEAHERIRNAAYLQGGLSAEHSKVFTKSYLKEFERNGGDKNKAFTYARQITAKARNRDPNVNSVGIRNEGLDSQGIGERSGVKQKFSNPALKLNLVQQTKAFNKYTEALNFGAKEVEAFATGLKAGKDAVPDFAKRFKKFKAGIYSGFVGKSQTNERGFSQTSEIINRPTRTREAYIAASGKVYDEATVGGSRNGRRFGFGNTRKQPFLNRLGNAIGSTSADPTSLFIAAPIASAIGKGIGGKSHGDQLGGALGGAFSGAAIGALTGPLAPYAVPIGAAVGAVTGYASGQKQHLVEVANEKLATQTKLLSESFEKLSNDFTNINLDNFINSLEHGDKVVVGLHKANENEKIGTSTFEHLFHNYTPTGFVTHRYDQGAGGHGTFDFFNPSEDDRRARSKLGYFNTLTHSDNDRFNAISESKKESATELASKRKSAYGSEVLQTILRARKEGSEISDETYQKLGATNIAAAGDIEKGTIGLSKEGADALRAKKQIEVGKKDAGDIIKKVEQKDDLLKYINEANAAFSFAAHSIEIFGKRLEVVSNSMVRSQEKIDKQFASINGGSVIGIGHVANPFDHPEISSQEDIAKGIKSFQTFYGKNPQTDTISQRVQDFSTFEEEALRIFDIAIKDSKVGGKGDISAIVANEVNKSGNSSLRESGGVLAEIAKRLENTRSNGNVAYGDSVKREITNAKENAFGIAVKPLRDAFGKIIEVSRNHANNYEKITNQIISINQKILEARQLEAERQIHIDELSGKHLSISQKAAPEEKIIFDKAGSLDPNEIGNKILSERKNRNNLLDQRDVLVNKTDKTIGDITKIDEFNRKISDSTVKINEYDSALGLLAKGTVRLNAIQAKLGQQEQKRTSQRQLLDKLTTASLDPSAALDFNKAIEGATALLSGGKVTKDNFHSGKELALQIAEATGGEESRKELETKIAQSQTKKLIGLGLPPDVAKKLAENAVTSTGGTPAEEELIKQFREASKIQVDAIRKQAELISSIDELRKSVDGKTKEDIKGLGTVSTPAPAEAKAGGGFINGAYKGGDSELIKMTPGEYVIKRSIAQKHRKALTAINNGKDPVQAFANGGFVGDDFEPNIMDVKVAHKKDREDAFDNRMISPENQKLLDQVKANRLAKDEAIKDIRAIRAGKKAAPFNISPENQAILDKVKASRVDIIHHDEVDRRNKRISIANRGLAHDQILRAQKALDRGSYRSDIHREVLERRANGENVDVATIANERRNQHKKNIPQQKNINDFPHTGRLFPGQNGRFDPNKRFRQPTAKIPGFASGGMVDSVLAAVTPGEFVVKKDVAQKHGDLLDGLNKTGKLPKFANGGSVGYTSGKSGGGFSQVDSSGFTSLASALNNFDSSKLATELASLTKQIQGLNGLKITLNISPLTIVHSGAVEVVATALDGKFKELEGKIKDALNKHINPITGETKESHYA